MTPFSFYNSTTLTYTVYLVMATTITKCIILTILSIALRPHILIQAQKQVPCFFIFGDSQSDNGNNNGLFTKAKANYPPYGIDYPGGVATGRFNNAKNIPDYHAQLLGFPNSVPPAATTSGLAVLEGVNYASGAAGILEASGKRLGDRISMDRQLQNHRTNVNAIAGLFGNPTTDNYLRQCLYTVNIGSNDYINNYYDPHPLYLLSRLLYPTPDAYANRLIQSFSQQLRTLYDLGARKVAVFGIGLIGCIPQELKLYPVTNGSPCVDFINNAAGMFNVKLVALINQLNTDLPGARFTYINATNIGLGDPSLVGLKVLNAPCCQVQELIGAVGQCVPNGAVCSNRDEYAFFDNFHPTDILMRATASRSFTALSPTDASPVDIQRLVQL